MLKHVRMPSAYTSSQKQAIASFTAATQVKDSVAAKVSVASTQIHTPSFQSLACLTRAARDHLQPCSSFERLANATTWVATEKSWVECWTSCWCVCIWLFFLNVMPAHLWRRALLEVPPNYGRHNVGKKSSLWKVNEEWNRLGTQGSASVLSILLRGSREVKQTWIEIRPTLPFLWQASD